MRLTDRQREELIEAARKEDFRSPLIGRLCDALADAMDQMDEMRAYIDDLERGDD